MQLNQTIIKQLRTDKGWTQQQLADVASLSLRTVQRIEKQGVASNETVNALCAVFEINRGAILTPEESASFEKMRGTMPLRTKVGYSMMFVFGVLVGSAVTAAVV